MRGKIGRGTRNQEPRTSKRRLTGRKAEAVHRRGRILDRIGAFLAMAKSVAYLTPRRCGTIRLAGKYRIGRKVVGRIDWRGILEARSHKVARRVAKAAFGKRGRVQPLFASSVSS
jgi:hypothetical protein